MRMEINGAKGIEVSQFSKLRSDLDDLLREEPFETIGSGGGFGGINIGISGDGPLTTALIKRIENVFERQDIGIGFSDDRINITVFSG